MYNPLQYTSSSFNTWAREEPNLLWYALWIRLQVSILGLARSPTKKQFREAMEWQFQYLGSRGAQRDMSLETNMLQRVSILGLARSPTLLANGRLLLKSQFQYLGSRGAQLRLFL